MKIFEELTVQLQNMQKDCENLMNYDVTLDQDFSNYGSQPVALLTGGKGASRPPGKLNVKTGPI